MSDSVQNQLLKLRVELEGYTPNIIMRSSQIYTTLQFLKTGRYACFLYSSMTDKFPESIGIPMQTPIRGKIGMIWKKSRYISSDMQTLISFTKKYYQMHSLIPSEKKQTGLNISPPFSVIFFHFFWKIVSYNLTVFHTKCRIFFIRHIRENTTARHAQCRCVRREYTFFHQIVAEFHPADYTSYASPQSRFTALVAHCEAFLRLFEVRSIACCGLPFPNLSVSRGSGRAVMTVISEICSRCLPHEPAGSTESHPPESPLQDFLPGLNRLLMPKFRQCNIRRQAILFSTFQIVCP